ncbi:MAG: PhzF family phenazine biosynthesis protein [Candidatus Neomarinimicrobiota bacterium]
MPITIYQVDSFTAEPFAGNPAGVCLMESPADEGWMQSVAAEMNLSETAFLYPDGGHYNLRWFTPLAEVPMCGHATLASAHILYETGILPPDAEVHFETLSGRLSARRGDDLIWLDFPVTPAEPVEAPKQLIKGLGVDLEMRFVGLSSQQYLVEVDSPATLEGLQPGLVALGELPVVGIIVTCRGEGKYDFLSRFFAPAVGIPEDPVTGSAHSTLGHYWSRHLGKRRMTAYQASARGGEVEVELRGKRIGLGGRALTVMRVELLI